MNMAATAKKRSNSKSSTSRKKNTKSVSKPVSSKKSVTAKTSKSNKQITAEKLKKFNIFAALSNAVFAVLSVLLMSKETVVASLPYAAKDAFASTGSTVFGPAYKTLCEIEIRYILAFIFGLSAVFSILLVTRLQKRYEVQLASSVSVIRWIFTAITLGLILELVTKLAQVDSIVTLKTTGALVVVTVILWIVSEGQNKGSKGKMSAFYLSLITLFLAVMPLLVSLAASGIYGMERFGWHVYALATTVVVGLAVLALSQYKASKNGVSKEGYLHLEGRYQNIDYLIKLLVLVILLTAFFK
jgi:hypothetical protein